MAKKAGRIKKSPIIIYLDQFAVSEMLKAKRNELWWEIKELLLAAKSKGKILCPLSSEHLFETAPKSYDEAVEHDNFLHSLSDGLSFKSEILVVTQLIFSRIRKNNLTLNTYFYSDVSNMMSVRNVYDQMVVHNNKSKELLDWTVLGVNQMRKAIGLNRMEPKLAKSMLNATMAITTHKITDRIDELLKNDGIVMRGDTFKNEEIVNWIDSIIYRLMKIHRFSKKEMIIFRNDLKRNGLKNIPTLDIRFSLESLRALYSKKETSGDQVDTSRLATGLPISDFLFTDKKRKTEVLELGLDLKYNTSIYSGTVADRNKFLTDLQNCLITES